MKAPILGVARFPSYRKDITLDTLAQRFNVAQFVSFSPSSSGPTPQFSRLIDRVPNEPFSTNAEAIGTLLQRSAQGTINIRSFSEERSQSRPFHYGLSAPNDILALIERLASEGAFAIANETIDVSDGGVSGVAMGGVVEFRPDATPRGVEQPGFASLPHIWARSVLARVYGFDPEIEPGLVGRLEFSIHPRRRGWRQSHTLYWEFSDEDISAKTVFPSWPNDFSRLIGDKVYGLLVAEAAGLRVPATTVICRRVAPFGFGAPTGSAEKWLRTSPVEQVPGKYTTVSQWVDPFVLVESEDPRHVALASIMSQEAVPAVWSGAVIETSDGQPLIEGTKGTGEAFMLGHVAPMPLPPHVIDAVNSIYADARSKIGPIRFEWVYDGTIAWIVQLHSGRSVSSSTVIVPGTPKKWHRFEVARGLEALRETLATLPPATGIILDGDVGFTSHIADLVRKANVPTKINKS